MEFLRAATSYRNSIPRIQQKNLKTLPFTRTGTRITTRGQVNIPSTPPRIQWKEQRIQKVWTGKPFRDRMYSSFVLLSPSTSLIFCRIRTASRVSRIAQKIGQNATSPKGVTSEQGTPCFSFLIAHKSHDTRLISINVPGIRKSASSSILNKPPRPRT